jgi:hypothetical protein
VDAVLDHVTFAFTGQEVTWEGIYSNLTRLQADTSIKLPPGIGFDVDGFGRVLVRGPKYERKVVAFPRPNPGEDVVDGATRLLQEYRHRYQSQLQQNESLRFRSDDSVYRVRILYTLRLLHGMTSTGVALQQWQNHIEAGTGMDRTGIICSHGVHPNIFIPFPKRNPEDQHSLLRLQVVDDVTLGLVIDIGQDIVSWTHTRNGRANWNLHRLVRDHAYLAKATMHKLCVMMERYDPAVAYALPGIDSGSKTMNARVKQAYIMLVAGKLAPDQVPTQVMDVLRDHGVDHWSRVRGKAVDPVRQVLTPSMLRAGLAGAPRLRTYVKPEPVVAAFTDYRSGLELNPTSPWSVHK